MKSKLLLILCAAAAAALSGCASYQTDYDPHLHDNGSVVVNGTVYKDTNGQRLSRKMPTVITRVGAEDCFSEVREKWTSREPEETVRLYAHVLPEGRSVALKTIVKDAQGKVVWKHRENVALVE